MIRTPYKTVGSRDLTGGMSDALSNTFQMLNTVEKEKLDKQRLDLQDARQARLDAINTPGSPEWIAAKEAEQQQKMADPMYNLEKAKINQQIAGTPEYAAAKAAELEEYNARLKAANTIKMQDPTFKAQVDALEEARKVRKGQEFLAGVIMGLPKEVVTKTTVTPEQVDTIRTDLESKAVVNAGDVYNKEYAKLTKPTDAGVTYTLPGGEEIVLSTPGTAMTPEQAHQEALKRAGLLDVIAGKAPVIDESKLPKAGTTESKRKLTAEESTQARLDAIIKAAQEGKVSAVVALEAATKLTPTKTQKEKLEEAKLALDIEEFKEKQAKGYYGKGGGSGGGDWLKTLNETYKTYGDPDLVGTGDRARIQNELAKIQVEGKYSDTDMKNAIEASMGVYANPGGIGVDNLGFVRAVGDNLLKMKNK